MDRTILLANRDGKDAVAVLEDGKLAEYLEGDNDSPIRAGNLFLGRVANIVKALSCAFVDIGDTRTGMLPLNEVPESFVPLHVGTELIVQITKVPGSEKGALLTANVKLPGKYCVLLPYTVNAGVSKKIADEQIRERLHELCVRLKPENAGLILRTCASDAAEEEISSDVSKTLSEWKRISVAANYRKAPYTLLDENDIVRKTVRELLNENTDKLLTEGQTLFERAIVAAQAMCSSLTEKIMPYGFDIPAFNLYSVPSQLDASRARKVYLKSGGFLVFDRTEALTVIDVNSGTNTDKGSVFDTAYAINMEAVEEIVRQIRLRDIGGIIIIDFIDMDTKARKEELTSYLRACFKTDRAKVNVVGLTGLGLMELTRKKSNERQKD